MPKKPQELSVVVKLSDGRRLKVGAARTDQVVPVVRSGLEIRRHRRTVTLVIGHLVTDESQLFALRGLTVCHPNDPFDFREGVRRALIRALQQGSKFGYLSRDNRREIFQAVCPWLFKKKPLSTPAAVDALSQPKLDGARRVADAPAAT